MVDRALLVAVTRLWPKKVHQANGQPKETISSWAWTGTRIHRHRSAPETRWSWIRVSSTQFRSNLSQAASTSSNATLSVKITKTCKIHRVKMAVAIWASSSKRQTSTSSRQPRNRPKMEESPRLACQAAHTTTRWIDSARRSPSGRTSTQSSRRARPTRAPSSRPLTTSSSKRSNSIIRWWASKVKTVNRCSIHDLAEEFRTSCRATTTNKWCIRITTETDSLCRIVNRQHKASTRLITTSTSTAYQATQSIQLPIFLNSRIERRRLRKHSEDALCVHAHLCTV